MQSQSFSRAGSNQFVTINLVVWNGEKYLRHCLDSILAQSYDHRNIEINIWDNNSSDSTKKIAEEYQNKFVESQFSIFNFQFSTKNIGMWLGQEKLLEKSSGEYIVAISVDIILDSKFVEEAVRALDRDPKIGAVQAKIYQYNVEGLAVDNGKSDSLTSNFQPPTSNVIDTCGFKIFRSRRLINIGHGEDQVMEVRLPSLDQQGNGGFDFEKEQEIFAVEGAVPVFRRSALEDCRVDGHFIDPDFFWYGDDIDLTWRMRMFGWKQVFAPRVIAYHDRGTTKALSGGWREYLKKGHLLPKSYLVNRGSVPIFKRRLDWRNWTLTTIKNDYFVNFVRDLPYILVRQIQMWGYFLIFEPAMILEIFKVARLLPRMLKRRRVIMRKAKVSAKEMRRWFV